MGFQSYQPNIDNLQQYMNQSQEKSSGGSSTNWWSIPAGMSSVRILPPWDPTGRVALPVYMHPIQFQGQGMKFTKYNWTCVNKTFGKPCPICEGLQEMSAAGVDVSEWEANRRQYYFNAIVMHDPTYNNGDKGTAPGTHVLMKAGKTVYDWVISQITNPMIGDITNVQNGIDIYITKSGQGLGTEYKMTLSPNGRTPIPQEYLDKITSLYNLDDIFSAGFEKEQIDELVAHLKKSAGVMNNAVSGMHQQMAGYTQAPIQQFQQPNNQMLINPNPFTQSAPQNSVPTPPAQIANVSGAPQPANTPVAPASPQASSGNMPKCFGQYDSGSVNCVVCPVEMDCAKTKNG